MQSFGKMYVSHGGLWHILYDWAVYRHIFMSDVPEEQIHWYLLCIFFNVNCFYINVIIVKRPQQLIYKLNINPSDVI